MYGHYFSFQIDSRPGGNAMKNAVLAVWRCTLLAGRCFLSFLFFLLWPPDRSTVSFFLLRVSFRNIKRNFLFYSSIIGIKTNFLIHFLISGYLPVSENTLRERSRSVEKRRILHGILYRMDFHPSLVTNEKPWNWIYGQWGKSGRVPTTVHAVYENWEEREKTIGHLAN